MGLIRQYRHRPQRPSWRVWRKRLLWGLGGLAAVFVLANGFVWLAFRGQALPNYYIGQVPVGGMQFAELDNRVSVEELLPKEIVFTKDQTEQKLSPKEFGAAIDWPATKETLQNTRSWLPLLAYVQRHTVPVSLELDDQQFTKALENLQTTFTEAALPERIALSGDNFSIVPAEPGYKPDSAKLESQLVPALEKVKTRFAVPTVVTQSDAPTGQLAPELEKLQKLLDIKITLAAAGKTRPLTRNEIGRFFVPAGQTLQLSPPKMSEVLTAVGQELGASAANVSEAVTAAEYAINKVQPITFVLAAQGSRVYQYCTAVRGVDAGLLPEFGQKLAAVFGDLRGWNQGGVALVRVDSGCDFTVWLSAPANMPGFGAICDSYYSCRVGPNVVINYDRWTGATEPWNAAGGSLEDYRVMVINHETGHWFGFDHRNCPGAGQPAPVMQQQSISLQGCSFNPWPTASELGAL